MKQRGPKPRDPDDRFWEKVDWEKRGEDECWNWTAGRHRGKWHGLFTVDSKTNYREYSHRYAWAFFRGPIPSGQVVRHKCDNPICCNPNHLVLGSQADNVEDCVSRGRHNIGEKNGNAIVTVALVLRMRQRYAELGCARGAIGQVAKEFGFKYPATRAIIKKVNWRHV